ncbi:hypothetical protein PSHT_11791 [Puccinia striiformis]|uniref:Uncharacterized protein n=1 Tax=Puccinia striiformis TaxID=27350 RepID=A0A2S4V157_9BASI|nr:hypothetical protein PSHT_11791 [Puccinia striiformis]
MLKLNCLRDIAFVFVLKNARRYGLMSSNTNNDTKLPFPKNTNPDNQTLNPKTTERSQMDRAQSIIFETLVKATPLLCDNNFSMWKSKILSIVEFLGVKEVFVDGNGTLSSDTVKTV